MRRATARKVRTKARDSPKEPMVDQIVQEKSCNEPIEISRSRYITFMMLGKKDSQIAKEIANETGNNP
jgi:hypothetical protein